jgi:hypothetical protein
MPNVSSTITICRPTEVVFTIVTDARNWPQWHPSSLFVEGSPPRPLEVGDTVIEHFRVADRSGIACWQVAICDRPQHFVIIGSVLNSLSGGTVSYHCAAIGETTLFTRRFTYVNEQGDLPDLQATIQAESDTALRRLKAFVEQRSKVYGSIAS